MFILLGGATARAFDSSLASNSGASRYPGRYFSHQIANNYPPPCNATQTTLWHHVIVPADYFAPGNTNRYAVLYVMGTDPTDAGGFDSVEVVDDLVGKGLIDPMIVVNVGLGSCTNSQMTTRDYPQYLASHMVNDLVPFLDANYRTLATAANRCTYGHSLPGYVSLRTGWYNYTTFGRVIACSPSMWNGYYPGYFGPTHGEPDIRYWPSNNDPGGNRRNNMRIVIECGSNEQNTYGVLDQANDAARFARTALANGWLLGDNIGYFNSNNYTAQMRAHYYEKARLVAQMGLAMLFRKTPLAVSSVEIAPLEALDYFDLISNTIHRQWRANEFSLQTSQDGQASAEVRVHFGPHVQFTYPDWNVLSSDNPAVAAVAGNETSGFYDTFQLMLNGKITTGAGNGTTTIRATNVSVLGSNYSATATVNVGTSNAAPGQAGGARGGANQRPNWHNAAYVVPLTGEEFFGTLPGSDPDSDPLKWRLIILPAADRADGGSTPGNLRITNPDTGAFVVYPNGAVTRATGIYVTDDGGHESQGCLAVFHFGAPLVGLNNTNAAFSMTQGYAGDATPSEISVTATNRGAPGYDRPVATGLPAWLNATVAGTNAPYTVAFTLNQTNANTLAPGTYQTNVVVKPAAVKKVLLPEADALHYAASATNYGHDNEVNLLSANRHYLTRWNLSGLTGTVRKATLRFRCNFADAQTVESVADDSWNEYTINNSYSLVISGTLGTMAAGSADAAGWTELDVTAFIEAERAGDGKATISVVNLAGSANNKIPTREGADNTPELIVYSEGDNADNLGQIVTVTLTVGSLIPEITTTSLPHGRVGEPYSQTLTAAGGLGAKTWSIISGELPGGLTLSTAGVISGTPTNAGLFNFTVRVEDSAVPPNSDTQPLSLWISAGWAVLNGNNSGAGSLRQAVLDATSGGIVDFAPDVSLVTLTSEILIDKSLTIAGRDQGGVTISGGNATRLMQLYNASAALNITLRGLTLADGYYTSSYGGAVYNNGENLVVENCVFQSNVCQTTASSPYGGALCSRGANNNLQVTDSTFRFNRAQTSANGIAYGGAVYFSGSGTAVFERVTFHGNIANGSTNQVWGGALAVNTDNDAAVTATLKNCTLHGNRAEATGSNYARGGGIYLTRGTGGGGTSVVTLSIYNSTIAGNDATSGTPGNGDAGGMYLGNGTLHLYSTIVAGNTASDAASGVDILKSSSATVGTAVNNLVQNSAGGHGITNGVNGNIIGQSPALNALADNGGPTPTMSLQPGSPAINTGANPLALATDQRGEGYPRVVDGAPDIGAFEYSPALTGYEAWKASKFTPEQLADPLISGDLADPDGDGIVNLLEYALNLEPLIASATGLPAAAMLDDHLTLTYTRRKAPTDVTYTVEVTGDLTGGWTGTGVTEEVLADDGTFQTVRATDPATISGNPKRFIHLKVTRP